MGSWKALLGSDVMKASYFQQKGNKLPSHLSFNLIYFLTHKFYQKSLQSNRKKITYLVKI